MALITLMLCASGCATAVMEQEQSPPPTTKKDAGTYKYDAGTTQQDSGMMQEEDTWVPPMDSSMCSLGLNYGTAMCNSCMQSACCAQDNACLKNKSCTDFLTCGNNCISIDASDPGPCINGCANKYPQGVQLLDAIDLCMQQSCGNDCR